MKGNISCGCHDCTYNDVVTSLCTLTTIAIDNKGQCVCYNISNHKKSMQRDIPVITK